MKKKMYAMLARMARDGDAEAAEELAEALPEVIESLTEPGVAEGVAVTAVPFPLPLLWPLRLPWCLLFRLSLWFLPIPLPSFRTAPETWEPRSWRSWIS